MPALIPTKNGRNIASITKHGSSAGKKRDDYKRSHEYELRQYRQAAAALHRWQSDGEKIDYKGWKAALDYLNKEQFMQDYHLQEQKEQVRRMEVVKREFIRENKQRKPDRYAR